MLEPHWIERSASSPPVIIGVPALNAQEGHAVACGLALIGGDACLIPRVVAVGASVGRTTATAAYRFAVAGVEIIEREAGVRGP